MSIFKRIMKGIHRVKDSVMLSRAVEIADEAFVRTGQRHYVMPSSDGKLVVMDRKNFRKLKQKRYIERKANVDDLIMECFYCTPYSNGSGILTDGFRKRKKKSFYDWCEAVRNNRKKLKKEKKHEKTRSDGNSNAHK